MSASKLKEDLQKKLLAILNTKQEEALQTLASARESRDSDTKSSAGDKHETARAMVQIEIEKNEVQLNKIQQQKEELLKIPIQKKFNKVELGSLVYTNQENYFFSIGHGKIETDEGIFYAISLAAPIGLALNGKTTGDQIEFQGRSIRILKLE